MLCTGYQKKNGESFPCGKCIACKVNLRRDWQARLLLESVANPDCVWVTLTYKQENEPRQLEKPHLVRFIKRLRRFSKHEKPIRFIAAGEYRPDTFAPHFHLIIWNHSIRYRYSGGSNPRWFDPVIEKAWHPFGGTHTQELFSSKGHALNRINYIFAYLLEKFSDPGGDVTWPASMQPEYRTMSRHPALGMSALPVLLDVLQTKKGLSLLSSYGTIPTQFRFESRLYPLPKLVRKKLSEILGLSCFTPVELKSKESIGITSSGEIAVEKTEKQKSKEEPATQKYKDWQAAVAKTKAKRKHRKDAHQKARHRSDTWTGPADPFKTIQDKRSKDPSSK